MIRINLLPGQQRPKAKRGAGGMTGGGGGGGPLQTILLGIGVLAGLGALGGLYYVRDAELTAVKTEVAQLQKDKERLEITKLEVEEFERQKMILDQRINVIQELQRNRAGGQQLLDVVATTVNRVDSLWLTNLSRKGNTLQIEGTAASISAVANLVTQLKRAGFFDKVEIRETRQDDRNKTVQIFLFVVTAEFALPGSPGAPGRATSGPAQQPQKKS